MFKKAVPYIVVFVLLIITLTFFNIGYRTLNSYSELTNRHNTVLNCFQSLSKQINNAAILNPDLTNAEITVNRNGLFYADSLIIFQQLSLLRTTVRDSVNIQVAEQLNTLVRSELAWLFKSNVPDSIIHDKARQHIAAFQTVDSLIEKGISRTTILVEYRKSQLESEIRNVRVFIISFIVLSGLLLLYMTVRFFNQQEKTKKKEKELEIVLNRINDGVVSVDNNWRYTFLNDAAMATHPLGREKTLGKVIWDIHPEMKGTVFWDKYHQAMETRKVVEIENYYAPMDIWFSVNVYPSEDGLTIFYKNITGVKIFQEQQALYASIVNSTDDAILSIALDGKVTSWNPGAEKLFQYSSEEIVGHHISILIPTAFINEESKLLAKINEGETIHQYETERVRKDGKVITVSLTISPIKNVEGKIAGAAAICRDVTGQKKVERQLAFSEKRFRSLIENSAEGITLTDEFSNVVYRSPGSDKITGILPKENTISRSHPDDFKAMKNKLTELLSAPGIPVYFQGRFLNSSDNYIWLEGTFTNLLQVDGVNAIVTNFRDVTQRKEAEEKLITSEIWFRSLIENSADAISVRDEFSNTIYRSPAALKIMGVVPKEITSTLAHPDDREAFENKRVGAIEKPGIPIEFQGRFLNSSGYYIWLEGTLTNLLHVKGVKAVVTNYRDITQRKTTEEKLIQSEKIYKTIASNIPGSIICLLDLDYRYLLIEGDMVEKIGYSKDKLLGNKAEEVLAPEIFAALRSDFKRVIEGEIVTKDSDRNGYYTISRYIPLKDENGRVTLIMTAGIDVSELKNAQRNITELNHNLEATIVKRTVELRKSNEDLEAFSYSVSHDLRAPLRGIIGFAAILQEDYGTGLDAEASRIIRVIKENAIKMGQLIDDLLAFSRIGKWDIQKTTVDTHLMVSNIVNDLTGQNINQPIVNWQIDQLPQINADTNTIRQVWINFLSNAVKYSRNIKQPRVTIESTVHEGYNIFSIRDNGVGFDEKYRSKLFKVFQRLHDDEEFEGTGVGLALVEKIVSKHGGKVWAEGNLNEGACFHFSLPV
jgi:PAS domain S-box-containing protein